MNKVMIDKFHCKTACEIFTGKNALFHALFWIDKGYLCQDGDILYRYRPTLSKAVSWKKCKSALPAQVERNADGVHMKLYEYKNYIIFGSQNNGFSSLFESVLVFKKKPKLQHFVTKTIARAIEYQNWWKINRKY